MFHFLARTKRRTRASKMQEMFVVVICCRYQNGYTKKSDQLRRKDRCFTWVVAHDVVPEDWTQFIDRESQVSQRDLGHAGAESCSFGFLLGLGGLVAREPASIGSSLDCGGLGAVGGGFLLDLVHHIRRHDGLARVGDVKDDSPNILEYCLLVLGETSNVACSWRGGDVAFDHLRLDLVLDIYVAHIHISS